MATTAQRLTALETWRTAHDAKHAANPLHPATHTHSGYAATTHTHAVAPPPVDPPPPTGNPSGQPMPTGDLPGFRYIFGDDFTTPVAEGQFPTAVSSKWDAYPKGPGWNDSPARQADRSEWGSYDPAIVSLHDSVMDIRIQTTKPAVNTTLAVPAAAGAPTITVASAAGIAKDDTFRIGTWPQGQHPYSVASVSGNVITLTGWPSLVTSYPAGAAVRVTGRHLTATPIPRLPGGTGGNNSNQLYGRYAMRVKADRMVGFKLAYLLWPQSETWPRDGEIDYPEAGFDGGLVAAFMHRQGATSGGDQDYFGAGVTLNEWHTYVTEWTPTRCEFFCDGVSIGKATARIPNTPMGFRVQNETELSGPVPTAIGNWHVLLDWFAVWAYAP